MNAFVLVGEKSIWKILRVDSLTVLAEGVGIDALLEAIRRYYRAAETNAQL